MEDLEEFADLFIDLENKQAELFEIQTTRQNKLNTLIREQRKLEQDANKQAIKLRKEKAQKAVEAMELELKIFTKPLKLN